MTHHDDDFGVDDLERMSDGDVMTATVDAIHEAVCLTLRRSWRLSQQATLTAVGRVHALLAKTYLHGHPNKRDLVLAQMQQGVDYVAASTASTH